MWLLLTLTLAAAAGTAIAEQPQVEFIAHRGESHDAPENTIAAFQLAWQRGVSTIELDVHLTRDGKLVVCHDPDTKRTTGIDKAIRDSTLDELHTLDAGRWKGARWAGQRMPTLEQALATVPEHGRCFIEIKIGPEAVPALVRAVRESGKRADQLVIISFKAETLAQAKRQLPEIKSYYLASFERDEATGDWTPVVAELIDRARSIRADGLNLAAKGPVDRDVARLVKSAGLALYVWTVDDPEVARRMIDAGVDGITSNRAAWLRARLLRQ